MNETLARMAQEAAARGARFLDERRPGWEREIDLSVLDLQSCHDCIIGQLYGNFMDFHWHFPNEDPGRLGFCSTFASACERREIMERLGGPVALNVAIYRELNRAWESEILKRLLPSPEESALEPEPVAA